MKKLTAIVALLFAGSVYAASSPVGYWKTIDDISGEPKSIVKIWEEKNIVYGKVVKLFQEPEKRCTECQGSKRNQPILGMTVMQDLRASKETTGEWNEGQILDPKNGKTYHSLIRLTDSGNKLSVRGYVGVPLFGRSQIWERVDSIEKA